MYNNRTLFRSSLLFTSKYLKKYTSLGSLIKRLNVIRHIAQINRSHLLMKR